MDDDRRRRNGRWLIAAIAAFFGAAVIAAIPVAAFATHVLPRIAETVAEVQPGETTTLDVPKAGAVYIIAAVVEDRRNDAPPHTLRVTDAQGAPVPTSPDDRWRSVFDKSYRHIAKVTPTAPGPIEIDVATEAGASFAILNDEATAIQGWLGWAGPVWGGAGLTLVAAIALFFCFLTRPQDPESLGL